MRRTLVAILVTALVGLPVAYGADGGTAQAPAAKALTPVKAKVARKVATPEIKVAPIAAAKPKAATDLDPATPAAATTPATPTTTAAPVAPEKPVAAVKAEQPEQQEWWQVLLAELLKLFLVISVPVLSTLVVSLLKRWKINVEFEQVNSIASKAAGWAEQKALAALKDGKEKTSGAEKMKLALDFANGLANQYKLSAKATEKLQDLIESALGAEKMKVAAATPPKE